MSNSAAPKSYSAEELLERSIFASRWLLVPFYLGLVLSLPLLAYKFVAEFVHFGLSITSLSETDTPTQELAWMVGIHLTFVLTGVLFALSEKIGHTRAH